MPHLFSQEFMYLVLINVFGFTLASSDIDFWNIDFLDTHLDLLGANIPNKYFVCVQDMSLQGMSSRRLEDQQIFAGLISFKNFSQ